MNIFNMYNTVCYCTVTVCMLKLIDLTVPRSLSFLTKLERLDLGCNELEDLVSCHLIWL